MLRDRPDKRRSSRSLAIEYAYNENVLFLYPRLCYSIHHVRDRPSFSAIYASCSPNNKLARCVLPRTRRRCLSCAKTTNTWNNAQGKPQ